MLPNRQGLHPLLEFIGGADAPVSPPHREVLGVAELAQVSFGRRLADRLALGSEFLFSWLTDDHEGYDEERHGHSLLDAGDDGRAMGLCCPRRIAGRGGS